MTFSIAEAEFIAEATTVVGGYSYRRDEPLPTYGYMVGGAVPEEIIPSTASLTIAITKFSETYAEALEAPGAYLGSWWNLETGKTHLDVSTWFPSLRAALAIARARREISIYSITYKLEAKVD